MGSGGGAGLLADTGSSMFAAGASIDTAFRSSAAAPALLLQHLAWPGHSSGQPRPYHQSREHDQIFPGIVLHRQAVLPAESLAFFGALTQVVMATAVIELVCSPEQCKSKVERMATAAGVRVLFIV